MSWRWKYGKRKTFVSWLGARRPHLLLYFSHFVRLIWRYRVTWQIGIFSTLLDLKKTPTLRWQIWLHTVSKGDFLSKNWILRKIPRFLLWVILAKKRIPKEMKDDKSPLLSKHSIWKLQKKSNQTFFENLKLAVSQCYQTSQF